MSVHKNLAELLKVCSVLPVLAVMPAMAGTGITDTDDGGIFEYNDSSDMYTMSANGTVGGFSGYDASDRFEAAVIFVGAGKELSVSGGATIQDNKAQVGGAIAITGNAAGATLNIGKDVKFLNNTALFDGGAIGNYGNTIVANGVLFQGNKAQLEPENNENQIGGGAMSLGSTSKTTMVDTDFIGNESGYNGGAIGTRLAQTTAGGYNDNSSAVLNITGGKFEGNKANGYKNSEGKLVAGNGGAIYNTFYSDVTVDNTHFEGNYAARNGGAIYNDGTGDKNGNGGVMTVNASEFEDNTAYYGGAIFNYAGKMDILGTADKRVVFEDNTAYVGGAFADMQNVGSETVIKNALFEENRANADAGAAGFYGKVDVENAIFRGNTAAISGDDVKADVANSDGGGAILVGGTSDVALTNVQFANNESGARGGAISARHGVGYELDIDTATFTANKSGNFGGGIANVYGGTVNMQNVNFASNYATKAGGAIYNGKDMNYGVPGGVMSTNNGVLNINGTNSFIGNAAGEKGGAIYNDAGGKIYFEGINTFAKNTAAGKPNDIYNDGLINIESGTTSMAAGVVGDGTFTISKGATLNLGTGMISQDIINIDGTINASVLNPERSYAKIFADKELNIGDDAKLNLTVGSVGTYDVFNGRLSGIDIDIDVGDTYKVSETQDGIVVAIKPVEELAQDTGLNTDTAAVVIGLATTSSPTAQRVSLAAQNALKRGDTVQVEQELAKLNPDDKPVAQSVSTSVQSQVMTLATNRMSGATGTIGRAGGDNANDVSGVWAQGLFNKSKLADQFHGYTRGFAIGADTTIGKDWLLGAGFAYNDSDVHASGRRTDIDGKTLFVYGQYKPTNWFVNGTLAYTMSEYTESVNPFGEYITSDYDVDTYGAQLMTGYDMAYGFTPSIGLRYMHVAQDAYTNTVNSFDSVDTDYLTGVAGLKYAFTIQTNNALKFSPEFRAALTYDFINDDVNTNVVIPGGMGSYQIAAERLSEFGGEFGIGLNMQYRGIDLSLVYDLAIHQDYTSQTGMIKLRSQF